MSMAELRQESAEKLPQGPKIDISHHRNGELEVVWRLLIKITFLHLFSVKPLKIILLVMSTWATEEGEPEPFTP